MENKYTKLKAKHSKLINEFPQFFAFNDEQFEKGLLKLKVDKKELTSIGYGGFIKKSDKVKYTDMWDKMHIESEIALKDETYLYEGFRYELANHEFCITYDYEETLNCFNLKYENLTDKQINILEKAKKDYLANVENE